jgi:hypothetical protein
VLQVAPARAVPHACAERCCPCAGELSSLPQDPQAGAGEHDPAGAPERQLLYPTASLLSTAMRPSPPPPQRQPSPHAQRANSVVSKTALGSEGAGGIGGGGGLRASTPASVYGQGQSLGRHARADSPAVEQVCLAIGTVAACTIPPCRERPCMQRADMES